jgi:uncharacterized LabA/DUF88 family protein
MGRRGCKSPDNALLRSLFEAAGGGPGRLILHFNMANFLYVDNSNVWIEGMRVAAVEHGLAPDIWTAQQERIWDATWRIDFGRLHELAGGDATEIGRAVLYGSRPPSNDSLWEVAQRRGFEPVIYDRNASNKEKKIDTGIVTEIMSDSFERMRPGDQVTLVSGDSDYVPTAENLQGRGFTVVVMFWDHAARELKDAATSFVSLNPHLDYLSSQRPLTGVRA